MGSEPQTTLMLTDEQVFLSARQTLRTVAKLLQEETRPKCERDGFGRKRIVYPQRLLALDLIEVELGESFPDLDAKIDHSKRIGKTGFDRLWNALGGEP